MTFFALTLTDDERDEVAHMLRIAAEQFERDAQAMSAAGRSGLSDRFSLQAERARMFAARAASDD